MMRLNLESVKANAAAGLRLANAYAGRPSSIVRALRLVVEDNRRLVAEVERLRLDAEIAALAAGSPTAAEGRLADA